MLKLLKACKIFSVERKDLQALNGSEVVNVELYKQVLVVSVSLR